MNLSQAKQIHDLIVHSGFRYAGKQILELTGQKSSDITEAQGLEVCRQLFQHLLDSDNYLEAATLQWGDDMFLAEPESVRRSFEAVRKNALLLIMGASSVGKSYGVGAWMLLDYLRDPLYTSVKLAAVSEKHLKENLYPHVAKLIRALAIPCRWEISFKESDLWMGIKEAGFEFGISGIAFKQSQETAGQFKGYKFVPVRKVRHPKFGVHSRLRVLLDEAQNVPGGPFQDFNSLTASINGPDRVKLVCAFNPENTTCKVVQMAEPEQGWDASDLETLYDYDSKAGWRVCRLDAARCENVIQRKVVYDGLQTYEGYLKYLKAGGDSSPAYFCFARGFPPLGDSISTIIPLDWPQRSRGEAIFIDNPTVMASVDLAYMGEDAAYMAVARWGLASGYIDHMGKRRPFKDRLNVAMDKPHHVLQVDQILPLAKHGDTVRMAEEIIGRCKEMRIPPTSVILDKTGIGLGTYSHLQRVWGEVVGVAWNEKATENKIVSDDSEGADKQCDGVMSEMWWALRRWMDPACQAILLNPIIPTNPLQTQLTSRRYKTGRRGIKVEPKEEYKARNAKASPDEADALVMLIHLVRQNGSVLPGMKEERPSERVVGASEIQFHRATQMSYEHDDDSILPDGTEKELEV